MRKPRLTGFKDLVNSFKQFKLNYSMNKIKILTELVRELQKTDWILKDHKSIHMAVQVLIARRRRRTL